MRLFKCTMLLRNPTVMTTLAHRHTTTMNTSKDKTSLSTLILVQQVLRCWTDVCISESQPSTQCPDAEPSHPSTCQWWKLVTIEQEVGSWWALQSGACIKSARLNTTNNRSLSINAWYKMKTHITSSARWDSIWTPVRWVFSNKIPDECDILLSSLSNI